MISPGSQYDAECHKHRECHVKEYFFSIVKFYSLMSTFDNLIGWMLATAGDVMLE